MQQNISLILSELFIFNENNLSCYKKLSHLVQSSTNRIKNFVSNFVLFLISKIVSST